MTSTNETQRSIHTRPLIRYLGVTVPLVAGLPSALATLYFLVHPPQLVENWPGAVLSLVIFAIAGFSAVRWLRIGAVTGETETTFRGFLITVRVRNQNIEKISRVWKRHFRIDRSNEKRACYVICGPDGSEITEIPAAVELCPGFNDFVAELVKAARRQRHSREPRLLDGITDDA